MTLRDLCDPNASPCATPSRLYGAVEFCQSSVRVVSKHWSMCAAAYSHKQHRSSVLTQISTLGMSGKWKLRSPDSPTFRFHQRVSNCA
jgi:hypothetical protein